MIDIDQLALLATSEEHDGVGEDLSYLRNYLVREKVNSQLFENFIRIINNGLASCILCKRIELQRIENQFRKKGIDDLIDVHLYNCRLQEYNELLNENKQKYAPKTSKTLCKQS